LSSISAPDYSPPPLNEDVDVKTQSLDLRAIAAVFWRTLPYLRPQLRHFILYYLLVSFLGLVQLGGFFLFFDLLMNKVFLGEPLSSLQAFLMGLDPSQFVDTEELSTEARLIIRTQLAWIGGGVFFTGILLGAINPYYLTWILQRVNQMLRSAMIANAEHLSLRFHLSSEVGDAIYRVFQDSAMVTAIIQNVLIQPSVHVFTLLFTVSIISLFNPYLGVLCAAATIPLLYLVGWFTPRLRVQSLAARTANSTLTSSIQEIFGGIKTIKAYAQEERMLSRFVGDSTTALVAAYRLRLSLALMTVFAIFIMAMCVLGAEYLMAHWAQLRQETFGADFRLPGLDKMMAVLSEESGFEVSAVLVGFTIWNLGAFQAARNRLTTMTSNAYGLIYVWGLAQDMAMGLSRSFHLLDVKPEIQDVEGARPMQGVSEEVRFEDVHFAYKEDQPVLRGIDLAASPGTITAIVGSTGTGKSTLMSLLLRLFDPDSGKITIDSVDMRHIRIDDLRANITIAMQENVLFATTIRENIRYAVPQASDEQVRAAARIACADEYIEAFDAGYETELGERAGKLSTGQRQRLSIARAVLKDPSVLILDEPTASLDAVTEHRVLQNLSEWGRHRVVFLITHRLSTIRKADRIVHMDQGRIAEQGSHDQLMQVEGGRYRAFVLAEEGLKAPGEDA
jgi:ABC-type multidrug transport system fused ATPase/permease subunit